MRGIEVRMIKLALSSAAPLGLPVSCWISGCGCRWNCSPLAHLACFAASAAVAALLFAALSMYREFSAISSLRD
jgi:hypothetical protein